ncbi:MAG TPA: AI-2E family transporter [Chloroflexota bacterium]
MATEFVSPEAAPAGSLESSVQRADTAWRELGLRIRSITPRQIARGALVLFALAVIIWVTANAWSQLLPFQLGFVVAYITLPVVNWLDRFMPRWVAASVLVLLELLAVLGLIGLIIPPLIQEVTEVFAALPDVTRVQAALLTLRTVLETLPPPIQDLLRNSAEQFSANVRNNALSYVQGVLYVAFLTVVGLFSTLGFVIGFLGIPTWLVAVMSDHRAGMRAVNRVLPLSVQPDFWAILRILDRTFSAFVRGQLLYGVITAFAIYAGFFLLEQLGLSAGQFRLVLALIAGLTQLIPAVGPVLGTIPAVAVALTESPSAAVATLAMYVIVYFVLGAFVASRVADRYVNMHPAIFVIVLVLLSQFGFLWVLVAAPLSIVLRDLFRYVYGRLSDPPAPAGVAPGERVVVPITRRLTRAGREVARG